MGIRPVSEKAAEILFNRSLLQAFQLGKVQLFAPTSHEEFENGYDAKVVGFTPIRELYLQFKSPTYSNNRFTIKTTRHQHLRLQRYKSQSAYYVAPMFESLSELNEAQASMKTAADFLKHFICIEVSALEHDVDFFQYIKPASHQKSPLVKYKCARDGKIRIARHDISGDGWLRGSTLLANFRKRAIGACYDLEEPEGQLLDWNGKTGIAEKQSSDFSLHIRIPDDKR